MGIGGRLTTVAFGFERLYNSVMKCSKNIGLRLLAACLSVAMNAAIALAGTDSAEKPYEHAMAELNAAKDQYSRWCALGYAAKESLNKGKDADAKLFAEELEHLAPQYPKDWNYGNAIQDFNIVLGRLALKAGNVDEAKKRLIAGGHSPGSPQMNSFGPNMSLAAELLNKKEDTVVFEYFDLCKKFWKMEGGKLDQWKSDVKSGRLPNFGANLDY
jgi:hypothetical protein